jgi:hypothetical protein
MKDKVQENDPAVNLTEERILISKQFFERNLNGKV